MLFPYQNNLKKYYYSEDLKKNPYCLNICLLRKLRPLPHLQIVFKTCKAEIYLWKIRLWLSTMRPLAFFQTIVCEEVKATVLNHLASHCIGSKPVFVGSSFGMPKHLYPTAKVVTLCWFVPLLGRSCIEINNCWFKEIIASLKQSISTDSRGIRQCWSVSLRIYSCTSYLLETKVAFDR